MPVNQRQAYACVVHRDPGAAVRLPRENRATARDGDNAWREGN